MEPSSGDDKGNDNNDGVDDSFEGLQSLYSNLSFARITKSLTFNTQPTLNFTNLDKTICEMGYKHEDWGPDFCEPLEKKPNVYSLLRQLIENRVKTNMTVKIGEDRIETHLMVLQCYSLLFYDMDNKLAEVNLPPEHVTPEAFCTIYEWMLTNRAHVPRKHLLDVFKAAEYMGIQQLCDQCWTCLDDEKRFTEDTAFLIYWQSKSCGMEAHVAPLLKRISKFFNTLVATKEWVLLSKAEVLALLESNELGVNSETEVFMAAVRWLNYDWTNRQDSTLEIMKMIRFSFVPPWLVGSLHMKDCCSELQRFANVRGLRELMHDGLAYSATQLLYGENNEGFSKYLKKNEMLPESPRNWIYDRSCQYHHRLNCPNTSCFSYEDYKRYLSLIQTMPTTSWQSLEPAGTGMCRCGLTFSITTSAEDANMPFVNVNNFSRTQQYNVTRHKSKDCNIAANAKNRSFILCQKAKAFKIVKELDSKDIGPQHGIQSANANAASKRFSSQMENYNHDMSNLNIFNETATGSSQDAITESLVHNKKEAQKK